jgi:hypothetical protein
MSDTPDLTIATIVQEREQMRSDLTALRARLAEVEKEYAEIRKVAADRLEWSTAYRRRAAQAVRKYGS